MSALVAGPALHDLARIRAEIARHVESGNLPGLQDMRAKAMGIATYLQAQVRDHADAAEVQHHAAELVLRIERGIGEVLLRIGLSQGRPRKDGESGPRLSDLGISKAAAGRFRDLARIPDEVFETRIVDARRVGVRLGRATMLRPAKPAAERPDVVAVAQRLLRWGDDWCVELANELLARAQRRAS